MFNVHAFLDNKLRIKNCMEHIPAVGDTVRFVDDVYGKVTEVIWCVDEHSNIGQRVNIRIESEAANGTKGEA